MNRYLYNEKELQVGSGYLDYGARMYMPEIGRMGSIDGAADLFHDVSPYSYGLNNPILNIDPSGDTTINVNDLAANWAAFDTNKDDVQLEEATIKGKKEDGENDNATSAGVYAELCQVLILEDLASEEKFTVSL